LPPPNLSVRPACRFVGLDLAEEGLSYQLIGRNFGLSKNTVMKIIKRGSIAAAA
jgi:hypothetical protein